MADNLIEQHIAVFGESGSGKTVLVSSFYGRADAKPADANRSIDESKNLAPIVPFRMRADDIRQGNQLFKNWVGMKDHSTAPASTKFDDSRYSFTGTIPVKNAGRRQRGEAKSVMQIRLVWHDYPGEWFEQEPSSLEERARRSATIRELVSCDVAFLLVDAQRLIDNRGQEFAYLKSLFHNFRITLEGLHDDLVVDGKPLEQFPRIWVIALSKADLLPGIDVERFHELVVGNAGDQLNNLLDELKRIVAVPQALALGQHFLLLSSAKFSPDHIDVGQQTGVDVLLPIALFEMTDQFSKWGQRTELPEAMRKHMLNVVHVLNPVLPGVLDVLRLLPTLHRLLPRDVSNRVQEWLGKLEQHLVDQQPESDPRQIVVAKLLRRLREAKANGIWLPDAL